MDSDGDEDFAVSNPLNKKVKKSAGEDKTKNKKGSVSKDNIPSHSPKRKTPKRKKNDDKDESKKPKAKAKKANDKNDGDEDGYDSGDKENFNDENEDSVINNDEDDNSDEEFENTSKKKKSEKKAPKGKKEKGTSGNLDQDQKEILEYLKKQNRPYSIQNIFDNLHGKIKKAVCQKALDTLTDDGHLQAKEFGKAKLYLLNQQNIPDVSGSELDKLKEELNTTKEEYSKLAEEVKEMNTYLKNLANALTNDELSDEIKKYKNMIDETSSKLEIYESGNYPKISDEQMASAEEKKKKLEVEYKKRKRMCMDMINSVADSTEQKLSNIIESIGIETD